MPYFMDVHRGLEGTTPDEIAEAHRMDVEVQDRYGVTYHRYWFDPEAGSVFCFVEAPDEEACHAVHREAHGLEADRLIRVEPEQVEIFLGDGTESPVGTALRPDGSLDPAFRVIVVTRIANLTEVARRRGDEAAAELVRRHDEIVRDAVGRCGGREAHHGGEGLMACFSSSAGAIRCAAAIQEAAAGVPDGSDGPRPEIGIGMTVGEPVERHESLFGFSVNLAQRISERAGPGEILVSEGARELALGKEVRFLDRGPARLRGLDEPVGLHEVEWRREEAPAEGEEDGPAVASAEAGRSPAGRARTAWERLAGFVREMRRRRVFQVAAVYGVVAFVVVEAADLLVPALLLPDWVFRAVVLTAILGFPVALVLAWAFEIAPGGGVRREGGEAGEPGTGAADR